MPVASLRKIHLRWHSAGKALANQSGSLQAFRPYSRSLGCCSTKWRTVPVERRLAADVQAGNPRTQPGASPAIAIASGESGRTKTPRAKRRSQPART
jgi:hypothetical protein